MYFMACLLYGLGAVSGASYTSRSRLRVLDSGRTRIRLSAWQGYNGRQTMGKLLVFNTVSLDGYFTRTNGDMSWAHAAPDDAEWSQFVSGNAQGGGTLLLGRVTYDMMAGWWPTQQAA